MFCADLRPLLMLKLRDCTYYLTRLHQDVRGGLLLLLAIVVGPMEEATPAGVAFSFICIIVVIFTNPMYALILVKHMSAQRHPRDRVVGVKTTDLCFVNGKINLVPLWRKLLHWRWQALTGQRQEKVFVARRTLSMVQLIAICEAVATPSTYEKTRAGLQNRNALIQLPRAFKGHGMGSLRYTFVLRTCTDWGLIAGEQSKAMQQAVRVACRGVLPSRTSLPLTLLLPPYPPQPCPPCPCLYPFPYICASDRVCMDV